MINIGDIFVLNSQGIRLKVEHVFPARPASPGTRYMRPLPAVPETYQVIELDGPTPGMSWTASGSFFDEHCTRVQP